MKVLEMRRVERLKLVQLACHAAWADLSVQNEEREVILSLAKHLQLPAEDIDCVVSWLKHGPPDFDPYDIPASHRKAFFETMMEVVNADGRVDPEESETIQLLRELTG